MFQPYRVFMLLSVTALLVTVQSSTYIDCQTGTLNVIVSAPHGGNLTPSAIPDRDAGCYNDKCDYSHNCGTKDATKCGVSTRQDSKTWELALAVKGELYRLTGKYPHVVINKLHRKKMDANRDKKEGAFSVSDAMTAWNDYHDCIKDAKSAINGNGLLIDLHGFSYTGSNPWAILGYLITKSRLKYDNINAKYTSIKYLESRTSGSDIDDLVKGADSFGAYLETHGFNAMPSQTNTSPGSSKYYSGGYITRYYGSRYRGTIDAIQIESPPSFRNNAAYGQAIAKAIKDYLDEYY